MGAKECEGMTALREYGVVATRRLELRRGKIVSRDPQETVEHYFRRTSAATKVCEDKDCTSCAMMRILPR